MKSLFKHGIRSLIDWVFRRKSPALYLVRAGMALVLLVMGGWAINILIPSRYGHLKFSFNSEGGTPPFISYGLLGLGAILIIVGTIWEIVRYYHEQKRRLRKKIIVIEARGLRDTIGTPLIEAIPSAMEGHVEQVLVDLRQRVKDNVIVDPETALNRLMSLPSDLERRENGLDRRDITTVYGGLTPVPFSFLTGVLMDDEGVIQILDWDRHGETWSSLDAPDDGKRFQTYGLDDVPRNTAEVALSVSVSYRVDLDGVRRKIGDIPMIHLELQDGAPDCHWSEKKQKALGKQFLDTVITLGNLGIQRIHLFISPQNSMAFRFGRLYDKRNLPQVVVYQYQREENPPHPWGVLMPVAGIVQPEILTQVLLQPFSS